MRAAVLWGISLSIYAGFFAWYTNLSGPLTGPEIEARLQLMRASNAAPERIALVEAFMRSDTGDDFIMVNLLDMNEAPPVLPATGSNADADDLMDHYMEHMYRELMVRASHPVFFGQAVADAMDIQGIVDGSHWERAGLVRYRSRRDLVDIALDPRFRERHDYKVGALAKTIAFPVQPSLHTGDPRLLLALLLIALTAVIHLVAVRRKG